jgi:alpha-L-fucosidase
MGFYHNTTYSFYDDRFPDQEWVEYMNNSIKELVDFYHPDILWGDVVVTPVRNDQGEPLGAEHFNSLELLAYFYNHSTDPDQVVANDRFGLVKSVRTDSRKAISNSVWNSLSGSWNMEMEGALLGDYQTPERRNVAEIFDFPWETCDALDPTSWGYNKNLPDDQYMSTNQLVDYLVDIVSKNGNLLINIGPRADGTIPEVQQEKLLGIGKWLEINGEAIYGTRYWEKFAEGNIRFTTKGDDALYAISLEWPGEILTIESLKTWDRSRIQSVQLLGVEDSLEWELTDRGLVIQCPEEKPCEHAFAFKIALL